MKISMIFVSEISYYLIDSNNVIWWHRFFQLKIWHMEWRNSCNYNWTIRFIIILVMEDHYTSLALLISPWLSQSSLNYTASENGRNSYEDTLLFVILMMYQSLDDFRTQIYQQWPTKDIASCILMLR